MQMVATADHWPHLPEPVGQPSPKALAVVKHGQWTQNNAQLVEAKHLGETVGAKYRFKDKTVSAGKTYRYKIQVVYMDGYTEWTGKVKIKRP